MTAEEFLQEAAKYEKDLITARRYLHTHAETGFDLTETLAFVKKELTSMGYEPVCCGKAGLTVLAGGKKPGKVFLIRGDMDALPIQEEADVAFPSKTGKMHACGHDMHTTMMLGAARLLKEHEDEINGTVKRVFDTSFSPLYIVTTVFKPFEAYFFVKFYVFICTCLYLCVIIDTRGDLLCM